MKGDARDLLNKKRFKSQTSNSVSKNWRPNRPSVDARKILNLKQGKIFKAKKADSSVFSKKFNVKAPGKKIQIAQDGNILITARSKNSNAPPPQQVSSEKWSPRPGVDADDLEHVSIGDVLNMRALPSALTHAPEQPQQHQLSRATMVADRMGAGEAPVRVHISNLPYSVSRQDITELFGDVGPIQSVERLRETALVDFQHPTDAANACRFYHNRLLDGVPMKCHLQNKVLQTPYQSITQRLGDPIQGAAPVSPLQQLPSSSRSRFDPHNVRFTVNL